MPTAVSVLDIIQDTIRDILYPADILSARPHSSSSAIFNAASIVLSMS